MSLALYRKYRPGSFAEVIGQEHVTEPLAQAIRNGRVHHAYLFSGPRGCGKTSSARILARSLNCAEGPTPTPCGVCDSCVALAPNGPGSLDVIEIDAASHGGVDDARDLRERAFYAPVSSRYKVYIVDEAHMVSREGFNALLKLVEEPPPHVKFVFATTEPEKVLSTIRSRTHTYPFRLVPPKVLQANLLAICATEGVEVDPLVLPLVVRAGGGSVRDAQSVLDQLLAGAGPEGVTYAGALALLGYTDAALLDEVVDAFAAGDGAAVFAAVDRVVESGHDPRRFAADLLERYRDLLVLDAVPDAAGKGLLDVPADSLERMVAQAGRIGTAEISRAADLLNAGLTEMRGATAPRLLLELLCARVLLPAASGDSAAVLARLSRLERRLAIGGAPAAASEDSPPRPREREAAPADARPAPAEAVAAPPPTSPPVAPADSGADPVAAAAASAGGPGGAGGVQLDGAAVRRLWPDVVDAVKSRKRTTHALLSHAQVVDVADETLRLSIATAPIARQFGSGVNPDVLREALREVLGVDWSIEVVVAGAAAAAPAVAPAYGPDGFAPGDEATDDDADAAGDPPSGEEAAMALLKQGLGAKVIGEVEAG